MIINLPWPDRKLSPNAKGQHWSRKAEAKRAARKTGFVLAREAIGPVKPAWAAAALSITFCPPDRRRRDDDNAIGAFKAYRDGIADALGIDDCAFHGIRPSIPRASGRPFHEHPATLVRGLQGFSSFWI